MRSSRMRWYKPLPVDRQGMWSSQPSLAAPWIALLSGLSSSGHTSKAINEAAGAP
ncbi:hypothetical protein [Paenibacillus tarimensis]|uniref:hypothetical protein n=1 Tax=Paenibacillus tarimensis TaxID=416012 RepID=UPI0039EFBD38